MKRPQGSHRPEVMRSAIAEAIGLKEFHQQWMKFAAGKSETSAYLVTRRGVPVMLALRIQPRDGYRLLSGDLPFSVEFSTAKE